MGRVQSSLVLNDQMSNVLKRINRAMGLTLDSFEAIQRASGKSFNTAKITAARHEMGAVNTALSEMEQKYLDCNNQQQQLNHSISQGANAAGGLLNKIKGTASAYLGMKAVKGAVDLSDTMTQTNARLSMMTDGKQSTEELNDMIFASAQRSRGSYLATADAVAKLGLMAGDAFSGNKETIAFMEQVNKQFKIAGTNAQGVDAAMLQLTQAMGSGVLRGEEYNSILEQAPNIIQAIAKYMNVPKGKLKEMAGDGKITADIVKAAMFACADETNAKFESMPKTWGDVWTSMKNRAIVALDPLLKKIGQLANSESVQRTVNGLLRAFSSVSVILATVFGAVCAIYNFISNNWGSIAPVVYGIATAFAVYNAALLVHKALLLGASIAQVFKTAAEYASAKATLKAAEAAGVNTAALTSEASVTALATAGLTAKQVATASATVAQTGFNSALLASPITWIVLAIIAVIAALYAVVGVINKLTGSTISATGLIFGSVCWLASVIWNTVIGVINAIIQSLWTRLIEPWINIVEWVLNVFNGGFNSFGDAVKNLLGNIISWFLSLGKVVTKIIDAIFGTDWTTGLNSLQNKLTSWGKNDNAITLSRDAPTVQAMTGGKVDRWASKGAWHTGYTAGQKVDAAVGKGLGKLKDKFSGNASDPTGGAVNDIVKNTGDTAKNTGKSNEELSYLRDIAEREAINRFTTAEIKVDMSGMSNRIDSNMDIDGVISHLTAGVEEALITASEGVY